MNNNIGMVCALILGAGMTQLQARQLAATQAPSEGGIGAMVGSSDAAVSSPYSTVAVPESKARESAKSDRVVSSNRIIEEVVVTAQKREENIQDVPISIQAFSGEALAARGIESTYQLGQSVPSLQFTEIQGFTMIYMRGIGSDQFVPSADPSVAQYVDGIYLPQGQGTLNALGNVTRVEVLKGPQGTLFGRNATGGAISLTTEEPNHIFRASAELAGGDLGYRAGKAHVNLPLAEWLSASASGSYSHKDDPYTNVNYPMQASVVKAGRVKLHAALGEEFSIGLTAFTAAQQGAQSLVGSNHRPSLLGTALLMQAAPDTYTIDSDYPGDSTARQRLVYGNLAWNAPWIDVKLLASKLSFDNASEADFDGTHIPALGFESPNGFTNQTTGELQFVSRADTPFADRFTWVAGVYYLESKAGLDPVLFHIAPGLIRNGFALAGLPPAAGLENLIDTLGLTNTPLGSNGILIPFSGILGTKSYSTYAQGTWSFTDHFDLTLGGRFQKEKRYLTKSEVTVFTGDNPPVPAPIQFDLQSTTDSNFSPKVVLGYKLDGRKLLYAAYSIGYKSGTYNIANVYTPPNYILPEQVTSYELGAKLDAFDGLLRLNSSVFYNKIENLQSGFVSLQTGGVVQFLTVPSARTKGIEFDGTLVPLPNLDPGLALTGNAAYVDSVYLKFPSGSGFDPATGIYQGNLDFSGNEIVRAPKVSGSLGAVQAFELGAGTLELAADVYYNSGYYYDSYNTVKENPYSVVNARIGYLYNPWHLRVTAFTNNALDRRYHIQKFQNDFGVTYTLAAPRTYGLRLNWDF